MSEFSDYLKELIHSKENISTNSLIKYCNIDRSTMYKIINGTRRPPKREIFIKMAKFFQLTPSEYQKFSKTCIFRKNCASVPEERSAIPLQTEQSSAG